MPASTVTRRGRASLDRNLQRAARATHVRARERLATARLRAVRARERIDRAGVHDSTTELGLDRASDRCAAHNFAVNAHRWNPNNIEVKLFAKLRKQSEISTAISSEGPFVSDANFTQRFRMLDQLLHENLRLRGGKILIEGNDQQMPYTKRAN